MSPFRHVSLLRNPPAWLFRLLAKVINLGVVPKSRYTWRSLYFVGAGFSFAAAIVRACAPESRLDILTREESRASGHTARDKTRRFIKEIWSMLKTNYIRAICAICMMARFNFFSHGSQDLYPKYLITSKGLDNALSSKVTIISNCGAIAGGTIAGYLSQYTGRRLTTIICLIFTAAWIPLWILPDTFGGLSAGGVSVQSGVQGAYGVVSIYLAEVSPPAFRASLGGLAYQIGNAASSGAAQIEADAGNTIKTIVRGQEVADYGTIHSILIGAVIAWMLVCIFFGPEGHGSHFEHAAVATQDGAGKATATDLVHEWPKEQAQVERRDEATKNRE